MDIDRLYQDRNLDPRWDNRTKHYDTQRFPWADMFLDCVRSRHPEVSDLTRLHESVPISQLVDLRRHIESFTRSPEFTRLLDEYAREIIQGEIDTDQYMIQSVPGLRLVIPDQRKLGRLLPFHNGYWTGYDNGTHTIWTPVTKAEGSNTMQMTTWAQSKAMMHRIHDEQWGLDRIQQECEALCEPVELDPGQCFLFNQGCLHGNINNDTGYTRMSFDFRVAVKDIEFGRRRPGSYYRFPGASMAKSPNLADKSRRWAVMINPNDAYVGMSPYFMMREYILGWCKALGINPVEWSNEFHGCDWMPHIGSRMKDPGAGIVYASIYNFSISPEQRLDMFQRALDMDMQMIFCDENMAVTQKEDLDLVKRYYEFYYG